MPESGVVRDNQPEKAAICRTFRFARVSYVGDKSLEQLRIEHVLLLVEEEECRRLAAVVGYAIAVKTGDASGMTFFGSGIEAEGLPARILRKQDNS